MNDLEKRVNDLEIKFSYQDELVNELNIVVAKQRTKIDEMLIALKSLKEQSASQNSQGRSLVDDKPPHY